MGYRIDIDHSGCINCGICMDTCPVEALDMSRPVRPGIETSGLGSSAALDDGAPGPGRRVHRLRHLHRGVPGRGHDPGRRTGRDDPRPAPGSDRPSRPPLAPVRRPGCRSPSVTRESLKREHPSPWGGLFRWQTADRTKAWQVWRSMKASGPRAPLAPVPGRLPRRHRRRSLRRADRGEALRRGLRGRGRGQSVPLGLWLDLHRPVRIGLSPGRPRRADRHPDAQAVRRRARQSPTGRAAGRPPNGEGRHRRRWPGRDVRRLLPRSPRLPGHRLRGDAGAGRDDGHRDPVVPASARRPPGRDRADHRASASTSG